MALINCPECGKEVSDKAQTCINCGCPLAGINPAGSVAVAVNGPGMVQMYIFNMENGQILWNGRNGEIARFNVEKETEISIIGSMEKRHPERGAKAVVRGGRRYEYKMRKSFWGGEYVINEIDVIDSGR